MTNVSPQRATKNARKQHFGAKTRVPVVAQRRHCLTARQNGTPDAAAGHADIGRRTALYRFERREKRILRTPSQAAAG